MRAVGIVELPLVSGGGCGCGSDLLRGERPATQLAAVHAFDSEAGFIGGEVEGVQAVDQKHIAGLQGGSEGGHRGTHLK
ncbi:hypothetical protein D3C76_1485240 [compost metagenome]